MLSVILSRQSSSGSYFRAEEDGELVGSCFVTPRERHLYNFWVTKNKRRKGLGSEFLQRLLKEPSGPKQLTACPFDGGPPLKSLVQFYMKHGFKPTQEINRGTSRIHMEVVQ